MASNGTVQSKSTARRKRAVKQTQEKRRVTGQKRDDEQRQKERQAKREEIRLRNGNPELGVSICLPSVFRNTHVLKVKRAFIALRVGFVERVDEFFYSETSKFKRMYVHFAPGKWNTRNEDAMKMLKALQDGEPVRIYYSDKWFWKGALSFSERPTEAPARRPRPHVRIGNDEETKSSQPVQQRSRKPKGPRRRRIAVSGGSKKARAPARTSAPVETRDTFASLASGGDDASDADSEVYCPSSPCYSPNDPPATSLPPLDTDKENDEFDLEYER